MILDLFKLDGKVAIVTGARSGIGQGISIGLAEAGADVVGVSRGDKSETKRLVEETGRKFLPIDADLVSMEPIADIVEKAVEKFGRVDILCNNAGIIRRAEAIEYSEKDWDDTMNVNLKTAFFLSQAVARQIVKQGSTGRIINIASMLSFQGGIFVPSYTCSKSGIMGLTKALANEWIKHGINVNAIAPGYIATDNTQALQDDEVRCAQILDRIPAGRWGLPKDIMGAAVYLASDAASYVNGCTLAVDGGWLSR